MASGARGARRRPAQRAASRDAPRPPRRPIFSKREIGVWSIPKGQVDLGEDRLAAALRECREETGYEPEGPFTPLGGVKYKNHKVVYAWAVEGDFDPADLVSITFEMVWPPRSGKVADVPEVDRAFWFGLASARAAIVPSSAASSTTSRRSWRGRRSRRAKARRSWMRRAKAERTTTRRAKARRTASSRARADRRDRPGLTAVTGPDRRP